MLWKAIAKERVSPKDILWEVARKVVIPSGILWSNKAVKDIRPILYKWLVFVLWETKKSILLDNNPPLRKNRINNKFFEEFGYDTRRVDASGISEKKDIISITPLENDKEQLITIFW